MKSCIKNWLRWGDLFLGELGLFFCLFKMIFKFHGDVRLKKLFLINIKNFFQMVDTNLALTKTTQDSENLYRTYGDREIVEYFQDSGLCMLDDKLTEMSFKNQRALHLAYVYKEIDEILRTKETCGILEVGCGNVLNLLEIKNRYGSSVNISGMDLTSGRINAAREYFGTQLDGIKLTIGSITEKTNYNNDEFDLVFSMFCLEQIAYQTKNAVREMHRISSNKILMIEPVFENGNVMQKIYLITADHTRILLKSILEEGFNLITNKIINFQFNPSNQSTVLIIQK